MMYMIGLACIALGAWQLWGAIERRRQVASGALVLREPGTTTSPASASLNMMGEIFPPIILFVLVIFGLKATALYFVLGGHQYFTFFDLAGLLFLLGSYGFWVVTMTKYRVMPAGQANVAAEAARGDGRGGDGRESPVPSGSAALAGGGDGVRDLATAVAASPEGGKGGQAAA
jgi:hypothetical protein